MTYHLESALQFLAELRQNNNKPWFDSHRADYETARDAFAHLVDDLIDEFRAVDHLQGLRAKNCIARIYRDIRFSKDKTPYKTNMAALIAPGGWRSSAFGYYISIEPNGQSMVAGGLYSPTPEQLYKFRQAIAEDAAAFKEITGAPEFVRTFGAVEGERLKTAPKGYDRSHPDIDLLQLKQITAIRRFTDQQVLADDFAAQAASSFRLMKPFLNYLDAVMQRPL